MKELSQEEAQKIGEAAVNILGLEIIDKVILPHGPSMTVSELGRRLNGIVDENDPQAIPITPELSRLQRKKIQKLAEHKQHIEYLCFMMLDELNKKLPLETMVKDAIKKGTVGEDMLAELFFVPGEEDCGCCVAEGFTIKNLLLEWKETTEQFLDAVSGQ